MKQPIALTFFLIFVLYASDAPAWLRVPYEDAVVAERAELIVVARLQPASLIRVEHPAIKNRGASWEYHATLIISEVLKGNLKGKELPVILHYGLEPFIGGKSMLETTTLDLSRGNPDYPKNRIVICDNAMQNMDPVLEKAEENNLWFLRKNCGMEGIQTENDLYGIADPEDLQPLALKAYFQSYLAEDPEAAMKACIQEHPELAERAQPFLGHIELGRVLKIADTEERCKALLPWYLKGNREAQDAMTACGTTAAEMLIPVFTGTSEKWKFLNIIRLWGRLRFRKAVPLLIEVLEDSCRYWDAQELKEGWWNSREDRNLREERRLTYSLTCAAACALEQIRDPQAREVLEKTRAQWQAINFDNPQIVEVCEQALQELNTEK